MTSDFMDTAIKSIEDLSQETRRIVAAQQSLIWEMADLMSQLLEEDCDCNSCQRTRAILAQLGVLEPDNVISYEQIAVEQHEKAN